jgi:hypothetical protein
VKGSLVFGSLVLNDRSEVLMISLHVYILFKIHLNNLNALCPGASGFLSGKNVAQYICSRVQIWRIFFYVHLCKILADNVVLCESVLHLRRKKMMVSSPENAPIRGNQNFVALSARDPLCCIGAPERNSSRRLCFYLKTIFSLKS